MIAHIAMREVSDHLRTFRYLALSLLSVLLIALGTYLEARSYATRTETYTAMLRDQERTLGGDSTDSHRLQGYGWTTNRTDAPLRALRRPATLSIWARGGDAALPGYWQFSPSGVQEGPPLGDTTSAIGTLANVDYLFVCQVILGLLAVLLTFDAISGERESGTLRATLAHAVPRTSVVLGKFVGALLTLLPPLLLGTLVSLLVAASAGIAFWADGGWIRLMLLALGAASYLALFSAMGIAVSATTRSVKTSLVGSLVLWTTLVFVVPRLAALTACLVDPVPSADVLARRMQGIATELVAERQAMLAAAWVRSNGDAALPTSDFPVAVRDAYNAVRLPLESQLFQKRRSLLRGILDDKRRAEERRQSLFEVLARFSPAAVLEHLAGEATQTGAAEATRWTHRIEAHQRILESSAFDRIFGVEIFNVRVGLMISWSPDPREPRDMPPLPRDLPRFHLGNAPLRDVMAPAVRDLMLLMLPTALLLAGACLVFQRYDVRA